jgi:hypothetical protein
MLLRHNDTTPYQTNVETQNAKHFIREIRIE